MKIQALKSMMRITGTRNDSKATRHFTDETTRSSSDYLKPVEFMQNSQSSSCVRLCDVVVRIDTDRSDYHWQQIEKLYNQMEEYNLKLVACH